MDNTKNISTISMDDYIQKSLDTMSKDEVIALRGQLKKDRAAGIFEPSKKADLDNKILTIGIYIKHSARFQ